MPRPTTRLIAVIAMVITHAVRSPAQTPTVDTGFRDSVATWLRLSHVPGMAVGIIEHGRISALETFGERSPGTPLALDALFNVASLTKPVVAITALELVREGKMSLDESLAPYWVDPDIAGDPRSSKLTLRMILAHTTGFPNWRWNLPDRKLAFVHDPGTTYGCSGEGFEYLRNAMEHRFGRTLQQLSELAVFMPANITETTYGWNPEKDSSRFVPGHDTSGIEVKEDRRTTANPNAADWLVTTIGGYSRFAQYVLRGARLPAPLYAAMTSPQTPMPGKPNEAMGLGWEVIGGPPGDERILLHTGSDNGLKTLVVLLPDSQRGLVLFTNGERGMDVMLKVLKRSLALKALTP